MNQENEEQLKMTFSPNTIEHLGVRMYSTLPPVIAELISNSSDAGAKSVHIHLKDTDDNNKEIIVSDDGCGMSFNDINEKFLRIGRNRRREEGDGVVGGRKIIGKKGLGKLSFFGVSKEIEVSTVQSHKKNTFVMSWEKIISIENSKDMESYEPDIINHDLDCLDENDGTIIILRKIQRSSSFDAFSLADNISKFFIIDSSFNIYIKHNNDEEFLIENDRKYKGLVKEVEWNLPVDIITFNLEYDKQNQITGHLIATEKPIPPSTNMKGITLFSRKKLVNNPEYFSDSTSSYFFTYLTGWIEVDFIDDLGEDVISTNRQSLNWDNSEMVSLREFLQKLLRKLEADWREKRADIREVKLEDKTGLKIKEWKEHIPGDVRKNLDPIINTLTKDSEMSDEKTISSLKDLQELVPSYPYFHWHKLHTTLHNEVFQYFKKKDYYTAVCQGVIKYIRELQKKSKSGLTDIALIKYAFCPDQPLASKPPVLPKPVVLPELSVTKKFKRPDGTDFELLTLKNISNGHGLLATAMWLAFRNPLHHESVSDLRDSGLYSEQDCLDALSLLSHLFRRLDNAQS